MACALSYDKRLVQLAIDSADPGEARVFGAQVIAMASDTTQIATVPWPIKNKATFMLCMKHLPQLRGRYVPTDVFSAVFSFLRSKVNREVIGTFQTST